MTYKFSQQHKEPETSTKMLTLQDLMHWLGIGETTARKLVRERTITAYRICGNLRFKREDVEAWLQKECRIPAVEF